VLEAATSRPFADLIQGEVSAPLRLGSLGLDLPGAVTPDRVSPYEKAPAASTAAGAVVNAPPINPAYKWAGGGLLASAPELARLGSAVIRPGYLDAAAHALSFTPRTAAIPSMPPLGSGGASINPSAWAALAPRRRHRRRPRAARHLPETDLAVALLSNLGGTPGTFSRPQRRSPPPSPDRLAPSLETRANHDPPSRRDRSLQAAGAWQPPVSEPVGPGAPSERLLRSQPRAVSLGSEPSDRPSGSRRIAPSTSTTSQASANLLAGLEAARPDVVCLQELKAEDGRFPRAALEDAGYGAVWKGQRSWNGVAILARGPTRC
jgi:hypothetical protein